MISVMGQVKIRSMYSLISFKQILLLLYLGGFLTLSVLERTSIEFLKTERERSFYFFLTRGLRFSSVFFQVQCWQKQYRADLMLQMKLAILIYPTIPKAPWSNLCIWKHNKRLNSSYYMAICAWIIMHINQR